MGNYVLTSEVRAFKVDGLSIDLTNYLDSEIETEIGLAEETIEDFTNDIFYSKTETNVFDGNGLTELYFFTQVPYRLISITSVKELDTNGTTVLNTFTKDVDFKQYNYHLEMVSRIHPRTLKSIWPKGIKNIEIVGSWGRSSVPAAIKRAAIYLVLERLVPGSAELTPFGINDAKWADSEVRFFQSTRPDRMLGRSTGFQETDRLLERYINHVDMFLAIPEKKQTFDNV